MNNLTGQEVRLRVLACAEEMGWNGDDPRTWDIYAKAEEKILSKVPENAEIQYNVYMARICGLV